MPLFRSLPILQRVLEDVAGQLDDSPEIGDHIDLNALDKSIAEVERLVDAALQEAADDGDDEDESEDDEEDDATDE